MKNLNIALASLVVVTALGTPAFAQDQKPQPEPVPLPAPTQQAPTVDDQQRPPVDIRSDVSEEKTMATGRLVRVDTDEMTIVIKGADDQEQSFRYTDGTKVIGAQGQVSGLSTKAGSLVTIHFTQGAGDSRIATKVMFDTKK
jgi:hypothetical protein